jgi:hypothetical protein
VILVCILKGTWRFAQVRIFEVIKCLSVYTCVFHYFQKHTTHFSECWWVLKAFIVRSSGKLSFSYLLRNVVWMLPFLTLPYCYIWEYNFPLCTLKYVSVRLLFTICPLLLSVFIIDSKFILKHLFIWLKRECWSVRYIRKWYQAFEFIFVV